MSQATPVCLGDYLGWRLESWMEVLLVGLSPEILPAPRQPVRVATVRPGGRPPAGAWDAVLARGDRAGSALVAETLTQVLPALRAGGLAAVVNPEESDAPGALERVLAEGVGPVSWVSCQDRSRVLTASKIGPGTQDLVGLRRLQRTLEGNVERIQAILSPIRSREASERPLDGGWSIKEMVGHLGDLDRYGYLAALQHVIRDAPPPPRRVRLEALVAELGHNARPLGELLVRYRHFRHQSQLFLAAMPPAAWRLQGPGLDGEDRALSELVRQWVWEETAFLESLTRRMV